MSTARNKAKSGAAKSGATKSGAGESGAADRDQNHTTNHINNVARSQAEDDRLQNALDQDWTRAEKWDGVVRMVGTRSKQQCQNREQRLKQRCSKRTEWSTEDMQRLMDVVAVHQKNGRTSWKAVAESMGTYTAQQCRYKYVYINLTAEQVENRRKRRRVANMTPEQVQRTNERKRQWQRVANMKPEQVENRRKRQRVGNMKPQQVENTRKRHRVANMTPQQVENRRKRYRVANMTPKQVEAKRKHNQQYYANMTPEQVQQRNERQRVGNMTPKQVERQNERKRQSQRVANMKRKEAAKTAADAFRSSRVVPMVLSDPPERFESSDQWYKAMLLNETKSDEEPTFMHASLQFPACAQLVEGFEDVPILEKVKGVESDSLVPGGMLGLKHKHNNESIKSIYFSGTMGGAIHAFTGMHKRNWPGKGLHVALHLVTPGNPSWGLINAPLGRFRGRSKWFFHTTHGPVKPCACIGVIPDATGNHKYVVVQDDTPTRAFGAPGANFFKAGVEHSELLSEEKEEEEPKEEQEEEDSKPVAIEEV